MSEAGSGQVQVTRYVDEIARRPRASVTSGVVASRSDGPGSAAGAALRFSPDPYGFHAKAEAFAAEQGLTLPTGMVWSGGFTDDGRCVTVTAVSTPGFVLPSGHRHGSAAWRHRRRMLRRHLARCRSMAALCAALMAGAFALDRPVAGVLAACLVFMLLRAAAETRAEL